MPLHHALVRPLPRRIPLRHVAVFVALVCLTLLAVQPFLTGRFPLSADGVLHYYRLVAFDHSARVDAFWPRYSSGMAYGYGAPVFNYYSHAAIYLQEALHLLGLSFLEADNLGIVLYALLGTCGAYLLGRAWGATTRFPMIAGFVTAAAYTYAPYTLYDSIWRGTVSEFSALALLPWLLWSFTRLARMGRRRDFAAAVLIFALFIPLHNIMTLYSAGLLVVYGALLWAQSGERRRIFIRLALAFGLALGLMAFFWLPAIKETGYIKLDSITANLPFIDVVRNLLPPASALQPPITADPTQMQQPVSIALGWVQIGLAVLALGLGLRRTTKLRGILLFCTALIVGMVFMTTQMSSWLWRTVPLIRYSQFPWRWLGPASLLLALMAGLGAALVTERLHSSRTRFIWTLAVIIALVLYAVPWIYTLYLPDPGAHGIADFQNFERDTGLIGASSYGEYLPIWNETLPDPDRLRAAFANAEIIPRLTPPDGVTVSAADWSGTGARLTFEAKQASQLTFDWLYVPGWVAYLDGAETPVQPTGPEGFVSVAVPAGSHSLDVYLGPTPLQAASTAISGIALLAVIGVIVLWPRILPAATQAEESTETVNPIRFALGIAALGLALFGAKALLIDHVQSPLMRERFADGAAAGVQTPIEANFGNQFVLIGVDLTESVRSGESASISLYWRLYGDPVAEDYSSVVHLRDTGGNLVASGGSFQPGELATHHWLPGYYIQEQVSLAIPPGTAPGQYSLEAGLYLPDSGQQLDVINTAGNPEGVAVKLGAIPVERPAIAQLPDGTPVSEADLSGPELCCGLHFMAAFFSLPETAGVGDSLDVAWTWVASAIPSGDYSARLAWLDSSGEAAAVTPAVPLVDGYPTGQWGAGDSWTGHHTLYIPGSLEAGDYQIAVQVLDPAGVIMGTQTLDTSMHVTTPPRTFTVPDVQVAEGISWSNGITLLGYDLAREGDDLRFTFYWRPNQALSTSLRRFLHAVDSQGHIIAVQDGVPVDWTRPTTGWAPGEIIADSVHISGPFPEDCSFRLGWYDPATGDRVTLPDGGDTWEFIPGGD